MHPSRFRGAHPVEAVIFDFGNVICRFDLPLFLDRIAEHSSLRREEIQSLLPEMSGVAARYERGDMTSQEFYETFCILCHLTITLARFLEAYVTIFTPIPSTFDLIRKLKPHYRLGLLSNTNEWHFDHCIRTTEVFPLFDAVSLSFQVGALKPEEAIYRDVLRKLRLDPPRCVLIDDLPHNVRAAEELGMHGILYEGSGSLMQALRRFAVTVP